MTEEEVTECYDAAVVAKSKQKGPSQGRFDHRLLLVHPKLTLELQPVASAGAKQRRVWSSSLREEHQPLLNHQSVSIGRCTADQREPAW